MENNGIINEDLKSLVTIDTKEMIIYSQKMLRANSIEKMLHVFSEFLWKNFLVRSMLIWFYNENDQIKKYQITFNKNDFEIKHLYSHKVLECRSGMVEIPLMSQGKALGYIFMSAKKSLENERLSEWIEYFAIGLDYITQRLRIPHLDKNKDSKHLLLLQEKAGSKKHHQLLKLSYVDTLTQLYNRRFYEEHLKYIDEKKFQPVGVVIADINSLKVFNDAFSHLVGDELIKTCANVIKKSFETGASMRIGGDEFAVLIPNTSAAYIEEKVRLIEEELNQVTALPIKPSISFGYAISKGKDKILDSVVKAENMMYERKLMTSYEVKQEIIQALKKQLAKKDRHSELFPLVHEFAEALKLNQEAKEKLILLSEIHDIGEIGLNRMIFKKKTPLTVREKEIIHSHVKRGYRIVSASSSLNKIGEEMLSHHERWDGKGYPRMLKASSIPPVARAFAIVDAYHAMQCKKPYRKHMTQNEILEELKNGSGKQFDPSMINIFIDHVLSGKISKRDNI